MHPLTRYARRLFNRSRPRGGILMYHRVADEAIDPWNLCVTPHHFDEQMAVLAGARVQRGLTAFATPAGFDKTRPPIAITFDDGYVDNIITALPILERYEVPATIFVVTNALGTKREFWWDALTRILFNAPSLPATLTINTEGGGRSFTLDDPAQDSSSWNADDDDPSTPRQHLYVQLWSYIVTLSAEDQRDAIDQIQAWSGYDAAPPADCVPIDAEAVEKLARHPLITLGNHTLDHASLTDRPVAEQGEQIAGGHKALAEIVGAPVTCFSYPFGRLDDAAVRHVRASGVTLACTSQPGVAGPRHDQHLLPRLQVRDGDGESFARWLVDDWGLVTGSAH